MAWQWVNAMHFHAFLQHIYVNRCLVYKVASISKNKFIVYFTLDGDKVLFLHFCNLRMFKDVSCEMRQRWLLHPCVRIKTLDTKYSTAIKKNHIKNKLCHDWCLHSLLICYNEKKYFLRKILKRHCKRWTIMT